MIEKLCNRVYRTLGSGYSERIYHNALEVLLRKECVPYETERIVPIQFEDHTIGNLRADLIIDKKLIVEIKAVKGPFNSTMKTQLDNYRTLTGIDVGLLVNFPQGVDRDVSPDFYWSRPSE
jgi:GxxExxY protein